MAKHLRKKETRGPGKLGGQAKLFHVPALVSVNRNIYNDYLSAYQGCAHEEIQLKDPKATLCSVVNQAVAICDHAQWQKEAVVVAFDEWQQILVPLRRPFIGISRATR